MGYTFVHLAPKDQPDERARRKAEEVFRRQPKQGMTHAFTSQSTDPVTGRVRTTAYVALFVRPMNPQIAVRVLWAQIPRRLWMGSSLIYEQSHMQTDPVTGTDKFIAASATESHTRFNVAKSEDTRGAGMSVKEVKRPSPALWPTSTSTGRPEATLQSHFWDQMAGACPVEIVGWEEVLDDQLVPHRKITVRDLDAHAKYTVEVNWPIGYGPFEDRAPNKQGINDGYANQFLFTLGEDAVDVYYVQTYTSSGITNVLILDLSDDSRLTPGDRLKNIGPAPYNMITRVLGRSKNQMLIALDPDMPVGTGTYETSLYGFTSGATPEYATYAASGMSTAQYPYPWRTQVNDGGILAQVYTNDFTTGIMRYVAYKADGTFTAGSVSMDSTYGHAAYKTVSNFGAWPACHSLGDDGTVTTGYATSTNWRTITATSGGVSSFLGGDTTVQMWGAVTPTEAGMIHTGFVAGPIVDETGVRRVLTIKGYAGSDGYNVWKFVELSDDGKVNDLGQHLYAYGYGYGLDNWTITQYVGNSLYRLVEHRRAGYLLIQPNGSLSHIGSGSSPSSGSLRLCPGTKRNIVVLAVTSTDLLLWSSMDIVGVPTAVDKPLFCVSSIAFGKDVGVNSNSTGIPQWKPKILITELAPTDYVRVARVDPVSEVVYVRVEHGADPKTETIYEIADGEAGVVRRTEYNQSADDEPYTTPEGFQMLPSPYWATVTGAQNLPNRAIFPYVATGAGGVIYSRENY